ncbi:Brix domain [Carpediemonas membranifera]|uniref:Ribosome production factor 2 homolog n=1 Tax=Carpediemonas membranifera TaxID=201153 RepID=A0A8J6AZ95_9EUKA|nr:Brix domain [Carpediemonas membranifera]|eukprot:KAG9389582.1 Brix domain [Carpediemonas membranifera]
MAKGNPKGGKKGSKVAFESEPIEGEKLALVGASSTAGALASELLKDMAALKTPHVHKLGKKANLRPFEDIEVIQEISRKKNISLFMTAATTKKRGHTITLGRTFEHEALDMVELAVVKAPDSEGSYYPYPGFHYMSTDDVCATKKDADTAWDLSFKPFFIFQGDWTNHNDLALTRNLLIDMFRGHDRQDQLDPTSIEHTPVVVCTALDEDRFNIQVQKMAFTKSTGTQPFVKNNLAGFAVEFTIARAQWAEPAKRKAACKKAINIIDKLGKNKSKDGLGQTVARLYHVSQDVMEVNRRQFRGTKRSKVDGTEEREGKRPHTDE